MDLSVAFFFGGVLFRDVLLDSNLEAHRHFRCSFLHVIVITLSSTGLGTIYGINALLCVVAFFKAQERGQSALIWIAKTLTVGGLALDQLSQLPTTAEVEAAKARKGKRALRNMKK